MLVFVTDGKLFHPECSPVVLWRYPPKGLGYVGEVADLAEFGFVDDVNGRPSRVGSDNDDQIEQRAGPAGEKTSSIIIRDGDDTLSNDFYCDNGVWMVRVLH